MSTPPPRARRRWTAEEDDQVRTFWGYRSAAEIAQQLGRTTSAILSRGRDLKLGSPMRGYLSLAELERRSGYAQSTIKTAARRIGVTLRRSPAYQGSKRKHFALTHEAADRILEELTKRPDGRRKAISYRGEWGGPNKPKVCVVCGTDERPHCSKGRCDRCDARVRRKAKKEPPT